MAMDHLLDSQVREVEATIRSSGVPFDDFKWTRRDGKGAGYLDHGLPTLIFKPDNFFFAFEHHDAYFDPHGIGHDPGGHQVCFGPGRQTQSERRSQLTWEGVIGALQEWLRYVAREKGLAPPAELVVSAIPARGVETAATPGPTAHPQRERVLGSTINRWLENEAERRGRLWTVVGVVAGLLLAGLALLG